MMQNLASNEQRAKTTILLLYISIVIDIVMIVVEFLDARKYAEYRNSGLTFAETEFSEITSLDFAVIGISLLYLILRIVLIVFFIMWLRRAYTNLSRRTKTEFTPGWAAGSWFVPILNLFRPFQIVKELWNKLQTYIALPEINQNTSHLGIWWALFLIGGMLGRISSRMVMRASDFDMYINGTYFSIASGVFSIGAAFFLLRIVKEIKSFEDVFYQKDGLGGNDITDHLIESN